MRIVVVLAVLFAGVRVAEASCGKGSLLFSVSEAPIGDGPITLSIEVRSTGYWKMHSGADVGHGCLTAKRLARVKAAVRAAQFQNGTGGACDAVSTTHVVYSGAKGTIETDVPCGQPIDEGTSTAGACVESAVDPTSTDAQLATACGADASIAPKACKRGKLLVRTATAPVNDASGTVTVIEARSTGAWTMTVDGADQGSGCLAPSRLGLLRAAVGKARFKVKRTTDATCRALNTENLTYIGPKKQQATVGTVCSPTYVDTWTQVAGLCLEAAVNDALSDSEVETQCKPQTSE